MNFALFLLWVLCLKFPYISIVKFNIKKWFLIKTYIHWKISSNSFDNAISFKWKLSFLMRPHKVYLTLRCGLHIFSSCPIWLGKFSDFQLIGWICRSANVKFYFSTDCSNLTVLSQITLRDLKKMEDESIFCWTVF